MLVDNTSQASSPMVEDKYKIIADVDMLDGTIKFTLLDTYRHQNHERAQVEIDIKKMPKEYNKFFAKYLLLK